MFCGKCGKENPNDNKFCFNCGGSLGEITCAEKESVTEAVVDKQKNEVHPSTKIIIVFGVVFAFSMIVYFAARESGDDSSTTRTVSKSATFYSMQSCLSGIRSSTGSQLEIATDTSNRVSGMLSGGGFFGCKKVESGSKGTYYEGYYNK